MLVLVLPIGGTNVHWSEIYSVSVNTRSWVVKLSASVPILRWESNTQTFYTPIIPSLISNYLVVAGNNDVENLDLGQERIKYIDNSKYLRVANTKNEKEIKKSCRENQNWKNNLEQTVTVKMKILSSGH